MPKELFEITKQNQHNTLAIPMHKDPDKIQMWLYMYVVSSKECAIVWK